VPSITLIESAKLAQDDFTSGIIETVVETNPLYAVLPFDEIDGNALTFTREKTLGDVQFLAVGGTITARGAATFEKATASLTTIIGEAEVNNLIQATRSKDNNQQATQVQSKLKSASRKYQQAMITGDGTGDSFEGLRALVADSQVIGAGAAASGEAAGSANGDVLSFDDLDLLLSMIKDKDGKADFLMGPKTAELRLRKLMRAANGNTGIDMITMPNNAEVLSYNGVPFFVNDHQPQDETKGTGTNLYSVYAGTFDDGSRRHGIAGLTAANGAAGLRVKDLGEHPDRDESVTRVVWYAGLANFSQLGLACLNGIKRGG
jgi:HK97 family phage major capsid protein